MKPTPITPTARVTRAISAAGIDRAEREHTGNSSRAAYSARRANRVVRRAVRAELAGWDGEDIPLELDGGLLDYICGAMPGWA